MITNEELNSLVCSNLETQKEYWNKAISGITNQSVDKLLGQVNFKLVSFGKLDESKGVINKIYLVRAIQLDSLEEKELILKINNPESKWIGYKTNEAVLINHIRATSNVPVPNIVSYCYDPHASPISCSYILMHKVYGVLLRDILPDDANQMPASLVDHLCEIAHCMKRIELPIFNETRIGAIDENLRIVPIYPLKVAPYNYLNYWNESIKYAVSEIEKMSHFKQLATHLNEKREQLLTKVAQTPRCNNLNYDDEMGVVHGDLNPTNIIVNERTMRIECLLDWEWSYYGFDQTSGIFESWYPDEDLVNRANLANIFEAKLNAFPWHKKSRGGKIRQYLNHVYYLAFFMYNFYIMEYEQTASASSNGTREQLNEKLREGVDLFGRLLEDKLKLFDDYLNEI